MWYLWKCNWFFIIVYVSWYFTEFIRSHICICVYVCACVIFRVFYVVEIYTYIYIFFPCLIALAGTSSTMLNKSGKTSCPCLFWSNFVKFFFCLSWGNHVIFFLCHSFDTAYYNDWFFNVLSHPLHSRDNAHLLMMFNPFKMPLSCLLVLCWGCLHWCF